MRLLSAVLIFWTWRQAGQVCCGRALEVVSADPLPVHADGGLRPVLLTPPRTPHARTPSPPSLHTCSRDLPWLSFGDARRSPPAGAREARRPAAASTGQSPLFAGQRRWPIPSRTSSLNGTAAPATTSAGRQAGLSASASPKQQQPLRFPLRGDRGRYGGCTGRFRECLR